MRLIVFKSDVHDRVKVGSNNSSEQLSHIQGKEKTKQKYKKAIFSTIANCLPLLHKSINRWLH